MKKYYFCVVLCFILLSCSQTQSNYRIGHSYGSPVSYGKGLHPGIDFDIRRGTPIIAASDGNVVYVGDADCPKAPHCGGFFVEIQHGDHFNTFYGHLSKAFIKTGNVLKRGQLIGLSGASNQGYYHLHFAVCTIGGRCDYDQTYNPKSFWLEGKRQCFDPNIDYSGYSQKEITLPIACDEYAKRLISETKQ